MADVNIDKTLKTILLDTALVNLPKSISPKMHPKDHISTPFVYLPKKDRTSLRLRYQHHFYFCYKQLAAMKLLNHMNVGYRGEARRISGALYQRVAT